MTDDAGEGAAEAAGSVGHFGNWCGPANTVRGMELEQRLVSTFPPDFLLNRVPGGARMLGARFMPSEVKRQVLVPAETLELTLDVAGNAESMPD